MLAQRPTDRRTGCGKTARPVRREGQGTTPCSYPYRLDLNSYDSTMALSLSWTRAGLWGGIRSARRVFLYFPWPRNVTLSANT